MISIQNISLQFGERKLFNSISFTFNKSDRIGLVGKNGAGKSTLLKLMMNDISSDEGNITFSSKTTFGYLPQEIDIQYNQTVLEEAATAFEQLKKLEKELDIVNEGITTRTDFESQSYMDLLEKAANLQEDFARHGGYQQEEQIQRILGGLGFMPGDMHRQVAEFSGGWQMRLELAKILLQQPDYILLDEPTNHLDIESIIWLEKFLAQYDGGIMLISHDRTFLDVVCNRTVEIVNGSIFDYKANYSKFVVLREERREKQKSEAKRQEKYVEHTETLINKFRAKKNKAKFAQSLIKKLDRIEKIEVDDVDVSSLKFSFPAAPRSGQVVVKSQNIDKSYGNLEVLKNINFELERGEKIAFVGKNGAGKSTFSRLIVGTDKIFDGEMELGYNVSLGYFAQNQAETLDGNLTVFETLDQVATGNTRLKVRGILGSFLFTGEDQDKKVKVLSGGEKNRLAFAKLILEPYNLLVLDEPTNHLDMISKEILKKAIAEYDGSLIVVSHDREFLKDLTTKVYEFKDKNVKPYFGDITEFLRQREINHLDDLTIKAQKTARVVTPKHVEKQLTYEERKEQKREHKKLKNKVSKCERNIQQMEKRIAEIEIEMADAEFYMKNPKASDILNEHNKLQAELLTEMEQWEAASEALTQMGDVG